MALCLHWAYNDFSQETMFLYFNILKSNCNYIQVVQINLEAELSYVIGVLYFL